MLEACRAQEEKSRHFILAFRREGGVEYLRGTVKVCLAKRAPCFSSGNHQSTRIKNEFIMPGSAGGHKCALL